jgi:predicted type IV restriction endonuclease
MGLKVSVERLRRRKRNSKEFQLASTIKISATSVETNITTIIYHNNCNCKKNNCSNAITTIITTHEAGKTNLPLKVWKMEWKK